jgi:capsular polysaccharide biosynthesis protein
MTGIDMISKTYGLLCKGFDVVSSSLCKQNLGVTPQSVVRSIPERSIDQAVKPHIVNMQLIRNAGAECYNYSMDLPPAFRVEMHFARRHVYRLRDVNVNVRTGACAVGSIFFQESYGSLRRCLLEKPFPAAKGTPLRLKEPTTCVHVTGYYHFLCEEIPRLLWSLQSFQGLTVLLHRDAPKFICDLLDELRYSNVLSNDVHVVDTDSVLLDAYVFTQAEAYSGFVHSTDINLLRNYFLKTFDEEGIPRRRIYISRRYASRSFDNEEEIEAAMVKYGFETCYLEKLVFKEQVRLFKSVKVVVAPHGAGLANLLWCNPGTRVIEIFSSRHFNDCYARLCSLLGLNYEPIWAKETEGWGHASLDVLAERLEQS